MFWFYLRCNRTHVYECNPNGGKCTTCDYGLCFSCAQCRKLTCPKIPSPTNPPKSTKPPTKPPIKPPPKLPSSTCSNSTLKKYLNDACMYFGGPAMSKITFGMTLEEISVPCVDLGAFALKSVGGAKLVCDIITYIGAETVQKGLIEPI
ncbi:17857_t:CDS:1, partial [Gigaspora margarita]